MAESVYELNLMDVPLLPFRIKHEITFRPTHFPNWHENTEILYCGGGSGYFQCGENRYTVDRGDMVVVNSELLHCVTTSDFVDYYCLIIDRRFCEENGIPTTNLTFQEFIQDPELTLAFLMIFEYNDMYQQSGNFYEVAAIRSAVLDFLYRLCAKYLVRQTRIVTPHRGEVVKTAVTYIRMNLAQPLTLDDIAEHTGVNKHHLSRLFKQVLGKTVFETVRVLRCNEAKRRIEEGMSVSQAAHCCGFENLSYFTRTFKKYYNILPSQCRREDKKR